MSEIKVPYEKNRTYPHHDVCITEEMYCRRDKDGKLKIVRETSTPKKYTVNITTKFKTEVIASSYKEAEDYINNNILK